MAGTGTHTFRAFRNRNFTLFFSGYSVSQIGTWMQRTGVSWLVYSITNDPWMLGWSVFASQFPSFLFSLAGGIVSDRYNRYKILIITQTAAMVQAVLMALLALRGHYHIWQILSLSVLLGIITAFDVPARQPLVHAIIKNKEDLPNALALNSAMNNLARLIGPALSGIVLHSFGAGICFLINAISFVAVLISLFLMELPAYVPPTVKKRPVEELKEGFAYLKETPAIGRVMLMLAMLSLMALPFDTLLPVFAKDVFKGSAKTFGYINSFIGIGAIGGTFFLASLKNSGHLKKVLLGATFLLGIGLITFSLSRYFPLALALLIVAGFGSMAPTTICLTLVQVEASATMRGRVISFLVMALFGVLPIGSVLAGALSHHIGAPHTLLCQGSAAIIIALLFARFLTGKERGQVPAAVVQEAVAEELTNESIIKP